MSSRKNRLSLSKDIHKDAKTPDTLRTTARTSIGKKNCDVQTYDDSCEVSPSQGDYSPTVSFTQDTSFHAINGVSWEWNSPQRVRGSQSRTKFVVAKPSNHKKQPAMRPKYPEVASTTPKKPTGFNKFISKLNLLMEKENVNENLNATIKSTERSTGEASCWECDIFDESCTKKCEKSPEENEDLLHAQNEPFAEAMGAEFDDSKLDVLLIEASQTVEQKMVVRPPEEAISSIPSKPEPHSVVPIEMNDSDMDGFLVAASLMVEEKLSDSSQESTANGRACHKHDPPDTVNLKPVEIKSRSLNDCPTEDTANVASLNEGSSRISMSQDELKTLLEKKRREALRRLQNNRLKRGMKGTNSHG